MFRKLLNLILVQKQTERRADLYRSFMRREAKMGGQLFGPVPEHNRREFFCLDENTWVWHEEWVDQEGKRQICTTRYDVRPNGILKAQNGQHYQEVSLEEATRLVSAMRIYNQRLKTDIYSFV